MKKYFYLLPFFALIDSMTAFAPATWILGQQVMTNAGSSQQEYMALIFCSASVFLILALLSYSFAGLARATPIPDKSDRVCIFLLFVFGLLYLALGIYSLMIEPTALASDFFSAGQSDADYFRRLVKFSGFQIWCIALSAFALGFLNLDKISLNGRGDNQVTS
jgi:hypothetical protein